MRSFAISLLTAIVFVATGRAQTAPAPAPTPAAQLRHTQDAQQRARDLARELVTTVLDVQLRQLEENALQRLPLYADIFRMRQNIDGLVEADMAEVVELLVRAQTEQPGESDATILQARQAIRNVVVRLSIERQNLSRRLKTAELGAQVKRVIETQMLAHRGVQSLAAQPPTAQQTALPDVVQDQQDATALYERLLAALQDASGWDGEIGRCASEALAIAQAAQVQNDLSAANEFLAAGKLRETIGEQSAVLRTLNLLLERVEQTQGLISTDREAALELVRDLARRQDDLRSATRQTTNEAEQIDPLVARQTAIRERAECLPEMLRHTPSALPLADELRLAASAASQRLFELNQNEAVNQQGRVLASLAAIEYELAAGMEASQTEQSAEELRQEIAALEQAGKETQSAREVVAQSNAAPDSAERLQEAAGRLADARTMLPQAPSARLDDAAAALYGLAEASDRKASERDAAQRAADESLAAAAAEIAAALADARRKALAAELGELARAAEVLDRAAAAERSIAQQAADAREDSAQNPAEWNRWSAEQAHVAAVLAHASDAVSPEQAAAHQALADSQAAETEVARALQVGAKAEVAPDQVAQRAAALVATQKQATAAAQKMTQAADELRAAAGQVAAQLEQEASRQHAQVKQVAAEVDELTKNMPQGIGEEIAQLGVAQRAVRRAWADQERARGNKAQAAVIELEDGLAQSRAEQHAINRSVARQGTPSKDAAVDLALREQRVDEQLGRLAGAVEEIRKSHPAAATDAKQFENAVSRARQEAASAAHDWLAGDHASAQEHRARLNQALVDADAVMAKAKAKPIPAKLGPSDAAAQDLAATRILAAESLTPADVSAAKESLVEARGAATAAQESLANQANAAASQERAAQSLAKADSDLKRARDALVNELEQQMTAAAAPTRQAAQAAEQVDPVARAALQEAATPKSDSPASAESETRKSLEQAGAALAQRGERIDKDRQLAAEARVAAIAQREAASQLAAGREASESLKSPLNGAVPMGAEASSAANAEAAKSAQAFANAQRQMGQAASAITGQQRIGDESLRDALGAASQLSSPSSSMAEPSVNDKAAMGENFVPASPEFTAQMLGGKSVPPSLAGSAAQPNTSTASQQPNGGAAPSSESSTVQAASGTEMSPAGATVATGTKPTGQRTFREDPWFATLPTSVQDAIRAAARQPAPPAYEERLRRYFESLD